MFDSVFSLGIALHTVICKNILVKKKKKKKQTILSTNLCVRVKEIFLSIYFGFRRMFPIKKRRYVDL